MAATIKDIADATGLSVGTISRYLNGYKLKEENEVKISQAIEKFDFRVNGYARFLKTKKSNVIGLIIPSLQLTFVSEIVNILEERFSKKGYSVMITIVPDSSVNSLEKLLNLEIYSPEGLVVIPPADNKELAAWLKRLEKSIPVIVIDRVLSGVEGVHYVLVDNKTASQKATECLIENGHKKIGIITGDKNGYTTTERTKGYLSALDKNSYSYKNIVYSDYTREGGYRATKKMMASSEPPTAIFTTNYDMTLGALHYFNDHHITLGRDISLIGFDLDAINGIFSKKITMVLQPINEMAIFTANKITEVIAAKKSLQGSTVFECNYSMGETIETLKASEI